MMRGPAMAGDASATIRRPTSTGKDNTQSHRREVVILTADNVTHFARITSFPVVTQSIVLMLIVNDPGQSDLSSAGRAARPIEPQPPISATVSRQLRLALCRSAHFDPGLH